MTQEVHEQHSIVDQLFAELKRTYYAGQRPSYAQLKLIAPSLSLDDYKLLVQRFMDYMREQEVQTFKEQERQLSQAYPYMPNHVTEDLLFFEQSVFSQFARFLVQRDQSIAAAVAQDMEQQRKQLLFLNSENAMLKRENSKLQVQIAALENSLSRLDESYQFECKAHQQAQLELNKLRESEGAGHLFVKLLKQHLDSPELASISKSLSLSTAEALISLLSKADSDKTSHDHNASFDVPQDQIDLDAIMDGPIGQEKQGQKVSHEDLQAADALFYGNPAFSESLLKESDNTSALESHLHTLESLDKEREEAQVEGGVGQEQSDESKRIFMASELSKYRHIKVDDLSSLQPHSYSNALNNFPASQGTVLESSLSTEAFGAPLNLESLNEAKAGEVQKSSGLEIESLDGSNLAEGNLAEDKLAADELAALEGTLTEDEEVTVDPVAVEEVTPIRADEDGSAVSEVKDPAQLSALNDAAERLAQMDSPQADVNSEESIKATLAAIISSEPLVDEAAVVEDEASTIGAQALLLQGSTAQGVNTSQESANNKSAQDSASTGEVSVSPISHEGKTGGISDELVQQTFNLLPLGQAALKTLHANQVDSSTSEQALKEAHELALQSQAQEQGQNQAQGLTPAAQLLNSLGHNGFANLSAMVGMPQFAGHSPLVNAQGSGSQTPSQPHDMSNPVEHKIDELSALSEQLFADKDNADVTSMEIEELVEAALEHNLFSKEQETECRKLVVKLLFLGREAVYPEDATASVDEIVAAISDIEQRFFAQAALAYQAPSAQATTQSLHLGEDTAERAEVAHPVPAPVAAEAKQAEQAAVAETTAAANQTEDAQQVTPVETSSEEVSAVDASTAAEQLEPVVSANTEEGSLSQVESAPQESGAQSESCNQTKTPEQEETEATYEAAYEETHKESHEEPHFDSVEFKPTSESEGEADFTEQEPSEAGHEPVFSFLGDDDSANAEDELEDQLESPESGDIFSFSLELDESGEQAEEGSEGQDSALDKQDVSSEETQEGEQGTVEQAPNDVIEESEDNSTRTKESSDSLDNLETLEFVDFASNEDTDKLSPSELGKSSEGAEQLEHTEPVEQIEQVEQAPQAEQADQAEPSATTTTTDTSPATTTPESSAVPYGTNAHEGGDSVSTEASEHQDKTAQGAVKTNSSEHLSSTVGSVFNQGAGQGNAASLSISSTPMDFAALAAILQQPAGQGMSKSAASTPTPVIPKGAEGQSKLSHSATTATTTVSQTGSNLGAVNTTTPSTTNAATTTTLDSGVEHSSLVAFSGELKIQSGDGLNLISHEAVTQAQALSWLAAAGLFKESPVKQGGSILNIEEITSAFKSPQGESGQLEVSQGQGSINLVELDTQNQLEGKGFEDTSKSSSQDGQQEGQQDSQQNSQQKSPLGAGADTATANPASTERKTMPADINYQPAKVINSVPRSLLRDEKTLVQEITSPSGDDSIAAVAEATAKLESLVPFLNESKKEAQESQDILFNFKQDGASISHVSSMHHGKEEQAAAELAQVAQDVLKVASELEEKSKQTQEEKSQVSIFDRYLDLEKAKAEAQEYQDDSPSDFVSGNMRSEDDLERLVSKVAASSAPSTTQESREQGQANSATATATTPATTSATADTHSISQSPANPEALGSKANTEGTASDISAESSGERTGINWFQHEPEQGQELNTPAKTQSQAPVSKPIPVAVALEPVEGESKSQESKASGEVLEQAKLETSDEQESGNQEEWNGEHTEARAKLSSSELVKFGLVYGKLKGEYQSKEQELKALTARLGDSSFVSIDPKAIYHEVLNKVEAEFTDTLSERIKAALQEQADADFFPAQAALVTGHNQQAATQVTQESKVKETKETKDSKELSPLASQSQEVTSSQSPAVTVTPSPSTSARSVEDKHKLSADLNLPIDSKSGDLLVLNEQEEMEHVTGKISFELEQGAGKGETNQQPPLYQGPSVQWYSGEDSIKDTSLKGKSEESTVDSALLGASSNMFSLADESEQVFKGQTPPPEHDYKSHIKWQTKDSVSDWEAGLSKNSFTFNPISPDELERVEGSDKVAKSKDSTKSSLVFSGGFMSGFGLNLSGDTLNTSTFSFDPLGRSGESTVKLQHPETKAQNNGVSGDKSSV